eukprot:EG_transcript_3631
MSHTAMSPQEVRAEVQRLRREGAPDWVFVDKAIGDAGAEIVANELKNNIVVHKITLVNNGIGPSGARALAEALKENNTLRVMSLEGNNVGNDGVRALAAALQTNNILQAIFFNDNNVGDAGVLALANALGSNTSLQGISLDGNPVERDGVRKLMNMLRNNHTLQDLWLAGIDLGQEGGRALADALAINSTLQHITYDGWGVDEDTKLAIERQLEANRQRPTPAAPATPSSRSEPGPPPASPATDAQPSANLLTERLGPLLDRRLDTLTVWHTCVNGKDCRGHVMDLDDNERGPCSLVAVCSQCYTTEALTSRHRFGQRTAREFFMLNKDKRLHCNTCNETRRFWLRVVCNLCYPDLSAVNPLPYSFAIHSTDTEQKLYLDLREVVSHDFDSFQPVFGNFQELSTAGIPDAPLILCRMVHDFVARHRITDDHIRAMERSLRAGLLRQRLEAKKAVGGTNTYLRIGLLSTIFGPHTAVLELWPRGHQSPIHQHGGCAGAIHILHGNLRVRLFQSLRQTERTIAEAIARPGNFAWLDRANYFVHEVAATDDFPFALSIHLYKSCIDEFEFLGQTLQTGVQIRKSNPRNDFVWLRDSDNYHDARREELRRHPETDFERLVLSE